MRINETAKNPYCPGAIRYCDVQAGIAFQVINIRTGLEDTGVFNSTPFLSDGQYLAKATLAKDNIMSYINLCDFGVADRDESENSHSWQTPRFLIKNTAVEVSKYLEWLSDDGADRLRQHTINVYYCRPCGLQEFGDPPDMDDEMCEDCDYHKYIRGEVEFKI